MLLHCLSPVCCPVTDPTRLTPEQEAQLTSLFVGPTVGEMLHLRAVANHVWQSLPPRQRNYGTVWFQLMHMLLPAPQLGPLNDALAAGMNMLEAVTAHPQLVTQLLFAMPACLPLWHAPPHPARDADLLLRCVAQNVCGLRAHAQSTFTSHLHLAASAVLCLGAQANAHTAPAPLGQGRIPQHAPAAVLPPLARRLPGRALAYSQQWQLPCLLEAST